MRHELMPVAHFGRGAGMDAIELLACTCGESFNDVVDARAHLWWAGTTAWPDSSDFPPIETSIEGS